ncbi:transcriptional regulator [Streptomyces kanamyceticus]|uniref:Transcriptional regulator n=2 Tax=Streptomyces kanamyceticus TaxID=1967 RepID=A0A5J6GQ28_STRKN|nr:transcriptional regulator [Streptomyces kanamyceticus]
MRLLEAAAEQPGGATAKRLARAAGLPLATAYHLLRTLVHDGYLTHEGGLYAMGESARRLSGPADAQAARAELVDWLGRLRDDLGAAVYYALYEDGEVNVVLTAEGAGAPAVQEWAEFRRTAHAHAIGQCLLAQLDDAERRDHLARHPVERLTPFTVPDERALLRKLARMDRGGPVHEWQQYTPGTVCAAVPITAGAVPSALAISLPAGRADQLRPLAGALRQRIETTLTSLSFSVRAAPCRAPER